MSGEAPQPPVEGDAARLPQTIEALTQLASTVHQGAQVSVGLIGTDDVVNVAVGWQAPSAPLAVSHRLCWSSTIKPLMPMCLALLQQDGKLAWQASNHTSPSQ